MRKNTSKIFIIPYIAFSLLFVATLLALVCLSNCFRNEARSSYSSQSVSKFPTVIIDAGHGGEDGGAIGVNGVYEKDLNLEIATQLKDMLKACGIDVVMTRTEDVLLYDKNSDYKGRKKILDLANRLKIANEHKNCIFVSIHMNSFPESKYNGLQVYYSKNSEKSAELALAIQDSVKTNLQKENSRKTKSSNGNIYLLDRIKSPAVLVECGFISNPEECTLLTSEEHQKKLSLSIFNGIYRFICEYSS